MISTVVFDFDGTLVDSNAIKRQSFFDVVCDDVEGTARMHKVLGMCNGDRRTVFAAYLAEAADAEGASKDELEALTQAYSSRVDELVARAPEMPGATVMLEQLRREGFKLYLSSATPEASLRRIVARRAWLHLFANVFGSPSSKRESILQISRSTGADNLSIAIVGDGEDDRDCAVSLGCAFFPVGDIRIRSSGERVFTLPDLLDALLRQRRSELARSS